MTDAYTTGLETTLEALAATAGALTILVPLTLVALAVRAPIRRTGWHLDARRNRRH